MFVMHAAALYIQEDTYSHDTSVCMELDFEMRDPPWQFLWAQFSAGDWLRV